MDLAPPVTRAFSVLVHPLSIHNANGLATTRAERWLQVRLRANATLSTPPDYLEPPLAQRSNEVAMMRTICSTCEDVMVKGIRMSISVARTSAARGTDCSGAYLQ